MSISLTKNVSTQRAFFRILPESLLPSQKQAKLVLSTKTCFYPQLWLVLPTKPVLSTQSLFLSKTRTFPESPLQSQKQAKLVFIHQIFFSTHNFGLFYLHKACFYPPNLVSTHDSSLFYPKPGPHQKRLYTKDFFPHPSRIAASIAKTSKACFYLPKPVSTQNSGWFYPSNLLFYPRL